MRGAERAGKRGVAARIQRSRHADKNGVARRRHRHLIGAKRVERPRHVPRETMVKRSNERELASAPKPRAPRASLSQVRQRTPASIREVLNMLGSQKWFQVAASSEDETSSDMLVERCELVVESVARGKSRQHIVRATGASGSGGVVASQGRNEVGTFPRRGRTARESHKKGPAVADVEPSQSPIVGCSLAECFVYLRGKAEHAAAICREYVESMESKSCTGSGGAGSSLDGSALYLVKMATMGTLGDRIRAQMMLMQEFPVARAIYFKMLLKSAASKCRREATLAGDAVKQLFSTFLLPPTRSLHFLHEHPVFADLRACFDDNSETRTGAPPSVPPDLVPSLEDVDGTGPTQFGGSRAVFKYSLGTLLLVWFEDMLKTEFANFILLNARRMTDPVNVLPQRVLDYCTEFLSATVEQQEANLSILVTKLCDGSKDSPLAAKHLLTLCQRRPETPSGRALRHRISRTVLLELLAEIQRHQLHCRSFRGGDRLSCPDLPPAINCPLNFIAMQKFRRRDPVELLQFALDSLLHIFFILIEAISSSRDTKLSVAKKRLLKRQKRQRYLEKVAGSATTPPPAGSRGLRLKQDVISSNSHCFRSILRALGHLLPLLQLSEEQLSKLELGYKTIDDVVSRIECTATKVEAFRIMLRTATLIQRDLDGFVKLFYNELKRFQLVMYGQPMELLRISSELTEQSSTTSFPLFRRLNQMGLHTSNFDFQCATLLALLKQIIPASLEAATLDSNASKLQTAEIKVGNFHSGFEPNAHRTDAVVAFLQRETVPSLASQDSWTVDPLVRSDAYLIDASAEERFVDLPASSEPGGESDDDDDDVVVDDEKTKINCDSTTRKETISCSRNSFSMVPEGYRSWAANPQSARADATHLWEIALQSCAMCPQISKLAGAARQYSEAVMLLRQTPSTSSH